MILLVNLPEPVQNGQKKTIVPPIGLWEMQEYLTAAGEESRVIDMNLGERLSRQTIRQSKFVCISARFSIQHSLALKVIERVAYHGTEYVIGGAHAIYLKTFPEFKRNCWTGNGVDYLKLRLKKPEYSKDFIAYSLSRRMLPYWKKNKPHDKTKTDRWLPITTSYGCRYKCGFCASNRYWKGYREKPLKDVWGELTTAAIFGVKEIQIEDDAFTLDEDRFRKIMGYLGFGGFMWSTPNGIALKHIHGLFPTMKKTGCWRVSIPFETFSDRTAELMNIGHKYIGYKSAKKIVNQLRDLEIERAGFFIIGYPGETEEDVIKTLTLANSLPLTDRYIYYATPYPGTALYESLGYQVDINNLQYKRPLIETEQLSIDRLIELKEKYGRKPE